MPRLFAYILLFIHINTTMFVPVVEEIDIYDNHGQQIGDINTAMDFIDQVILGNTDVTLSDADDDQPHFFTGSTSLPYYIFTPQETGCCKKRAYNHRILPSYSLLPVQKTLSIAYDIVTPPPDLIVT